MALIGNYSVLNKTAGRFTTGPSVADTRANYGKTNKARNMFLSLPKNSSVPMGYEPPGSWVIAQTGGGLATFVQIRGSSETASSILNVKTASASLDGSGTVTNAALGQLVQMAADLNGAGFITDAELAAIASLSANITGTGSITANLSALVPLSAALTGLGSINANLKGTARLSADITPFTDLSPEGLAAAVWNSQTADYPTAGTMGRAVQDAGSSGNPWSADLTSNNTPNTFGWFVQKLLTVAKFIGLKD